MKGFRNPINVRCAPGHNQCFALELARDYTAGQGGREKMSPLHQGDDWGFPCCASHQLAYSGSPTPAPTAPAPSPRTTRSTSATRPSASTSRAASGSPCGTASAYVVTHGAAGTWAGARMVSISIDPTTGLPDPSTNIYDGGNIGMVDFATGWDDGTHMHGRPSAARLASDGRLFVANDNNGVIFWIAPLDMGAWRGRVDLSTAGDGPRDAGGRPRGRGDGPRDGGRVDLFGDV